ncbi:MAG: U32 family peptidase [Solobacterium sp.]|nr:U32 family peptidase [Solobacterium sp.]
MKTKQLNKPELLAPAGDLARAKTAIRYGADAVYIGGRSFSLRSRASNFTYDDIREICAFAREYGAHVHVTVNIIPHDEDLDGLAEYLGFLQECGVHAVICASPYIMNCAKKYAPHLEVHCSTQLSVTNSSAVRFLKRHLDIDRVVLARECTMEDVRRITAEGGVPSEAFIHGGMCVNYSGRCTLSNRMTLRDANRGGCAQSCRWQYHLYQGKTELTKQDDLFTMGSRDLMCLDHLYDLMEAGVASFKIEGRMKTEFYIASVVSVYRRCIDEILLKGGPLDADRMRMYREEMRKSENRDIWTGFYDNPDAQNSIIYHPNTNVDVNHDFLGTVLSYDKTAETAVIQTRNPFAKGERAEILSPSGTYEPFVFEWMKNDKGEYMEISRHPMAEVTIPMPSAVKAGDMIRRSR